MKRFLLVLFIGSSVCAGTVSAQNNDRDHGNHFSFPWERGRNIEAQINHLNRMVGHVRWQLSRYHPDRGIRHDFAEIRRDVDRVNWQFRHGGYDRGHLHREIERLRERLHQLEVRMRVRSNDYYNWR